VALLLGNGLGRAAHGTGPTAPLREIETIGVVVLVGTGVGGIWILATTEPQRMALPLGVIRPSLRPKVPNPEA